MASTAKYSASSRNPERGHTGLLLTPETGQSSNYADKVVSSGPIGYWKLNESANTVGVVDTMGNFADGTFEPSGTPAELPVVGQTGVLGDSSSTSVSFSNAVTSANNAQIKILNPSSVTDQKSALSLEMWAQSTSAFGVLEYFLRQMNGLEVFSLAEVFDDITFIVGPNANQQITSTGSVLANRLNAWIHYVGTFQGGEYQRIYINGQIIAEETSSVGLLTGLMSTEAIYIGNSVAPGFPFPGNIEQVSVYQKVLTYNEIQDHYLSALMANPNKTFSNTYSSAVSDKFVRFMFNPDTSASGESVLFKGTSSGNEVFRISYDSDTNQIKGIIDPGTDELTATVGSDWSHVEFEFSSTSIKLYINDVLQSSATGTYSSSFDALIKGLEFHEFNMTGNIKIADLIVSDTYVGPQAFSS